MPRRLDPSKLPDGVAERVRQSHHEAIEELQRKTEKVAYARVTGATGAFTKAKNVERVERATTGTYDITLTVPFDPETRWIDVQSWDGSGGVLLDPTRDTPRHFRVYTFDTGAVALQDVNFRFRVS